MSTADGSERVEALIADFERTQDDGRSMAPRYGFDQLRSALELSRKTSRGPRSMAPQKSEAP